MLAHLVGLLLKRREAVEFIEEEKLRLDATCLRAEAMDRLRAGVSQADGQRGFKRGGVPAQDIYRSCCDARHGR